jgi:hypothetical protein
MNNKLEYHPISNIFPLIEGEALQGLANDIKLNGLLEPVVLYEGKILDGRNRYRACKLAGVEPKFEEFKGTLEAAVSRVWSLNSERRHLTPSQKACCDALRNKLLDDYRTVREAAQQRQMKGKGPDGSGGRGKKGNPVELIPQGFESPTKTRDVRAKAAGINPKYIDMADRLLEQEPEVFEQVQRGEKALTQATRERMAARTASNGRGHRRKPKPAATNLQRRFEERHIAYIDACIKEPQPVSLARIAAITDLSTNHILNSSILQYWSLLPWLSLTPTPGGNSYHFKPDRYIRAVCEDRVPRTAEHKALLAALADLRKFIDHDRAKAKARRNDSNWNPLIVHTAELVDLLDRIETTLDKLSLGEPTTTGLPPEQAYWVWSRLCAFEQIYLKRDPCTIADSVDSHMRRDIKRIIPTLVSWLEKINEAVAG